MANSNCGLTSRVKDRLVDPARLWAVKVKEVWAKSPLVVPEITPVVRLRDIPAGRAGLTEKVSWPDTVYESALVKLLPVFVTKVESMNINCGAESVE